MTGSRSVITPHASHSWGTIEGERCCVVCYAAPWMAMSERACGSDARVDDTTERDAAIREAYESGAKIKDIADAHGLNKNTVSRLVGRQQGLGGIVMDNRPRVRGKAITLEQAYEAMALQDAGHTWRQIGALMGRKPASIKGVVLDLRAGRGRLAQQERGMERAAE